MNAFTEARMHLGDVVRIAVPDLAAAHAARERVRDAATAAGRHPDHLTVLLDVLANLVERTVALRAADGITFLPLTLPTDLLAITGQVVPLLAGRGLFRTGNPGTPLRARFQPRRLLTHAGIAS